MPFTIHEFADQQDWVPASDQEGFDDDGLELIDQASVAGHHLEVVEILWTGEKDSKYKNPDGSPKRQHSVLVRVRDVCCTPEQDQKMFLAGAKVTADVFHVLTLEAADAEENFRKPEPLLCTIMREPGQKGNPWVVTDPIDTPVGRYEVKPDGKPTAAMRAGGRQRRAG